MYRLTSLSHAQATEPKFDVACFIYTLTLMVKTKRGSAQTSADSSSKDRHIARTHSVSAMGERWEDFFAVLKRRNESEAREVL
jgi:hypothetical protein